MAKTKQVIKTDVDWSQVKVGDKVKVRDDLKYESYKHYNGRSESAVSGMLKFAGKVMTVKGFSTVSKEFIFEGDSYEYYWASEMLEGLVTYVEDKEVVDLSDSVSEFGVPLDKVIYSGNVTILFYYSEGKKRKVISRCQDGDTYDKEKGLQACTLKATIREAQRMLDNI